MCVVCESHEHTCSFHSGMARLSPMLMLRNSWAKCRSPASGTGSTQDLLKSCLFWCTCGGMRSTVPPSFPQPRSLLCPPPTHPHQRMRIHTDTTTQTLALGIWSIREDTCACRSSRRSLASWDCVMAARLREPSGFLTMRGGESSLCLKRRLEGVGGRWGRVGVCVDIHGHPHRRDSNTPPTLLQQINGP